MENFTIAVKGVMSNFPTIGLVECLDIEEMVPRRTIECVWTIPNFLETSRSLPYNSIHKIRSQDFPEDANEENQWFLVLQQQNNLLTIVGKRVKDTVETNSYFELSVLNWKHETGCSTKGSSLNSFLWQLPENIHEISSLKLILKGSLTIVCKITEYDSDEISATKYVSEPGLWVKNSGDTDYEVRTEGKNIPCHRAALKSSRVFEKMLESDMKETREKLIDLSGVLDAETADSLVSYLQTGQVSNIESTCHTLLPAAHAYELERLKIICQLEMAKNMTVENAAEFLFIATTYNTHWLTRHCVLFVKAHLDQVELTSGWKNLTKEFLGSVFMEFMNV